MKGGLRYQRETAAENKRKFHQTVEKKKNTHGDRKLVGGFDVDGRVGLRWDVTVELSAVVIPLQGIEAASGQVIGTAQRGLAPCEGVLRDCHSPQ